MMLVYAGRLCTPRASYARRNRRTTGTGMMKPTPSASSLPAKATPTTLLVTWLNTGPPLLPGLMAASSCMSAQASLPKLCA